MPDVKFRGWDSYQNRMIQWEEIGNPNISIMSLWNFLNGLTEHIKPLQFAGLHDRNGKEVYEGDICKVHIFIQELGENMGVIEGEKEFVAKITFDSSGVNLIGKNELESGPIWAYGGFHEESLEVIGNIYENPELLNREV